VLGARRPRGRGGRDGDHPPRLAGPQLRPAADLGQFNPGNIVSDSVFFDGYAMGAGEIQAFLNVKGSSCTVGSDGSPCLKNYRQDTVSHRTTPTEVFSPQLSAG
jgi:hypothetical protein